MMKKQIISVIMILAILSTMASCRKRVAVETSSDYYISVPGQGEANTDAADSSASNPASQTTSGTASGSSAAQGTIKRDFTIKEGKTPIEEGLDFGGKTFIMAIPYTPSDAVKAKIAAFESKYHLKINLKIFSL